MHRLIVVLLLVATFVAPLALGAPPRAEDRSQVQVNINTASLDELVTLPGIGPALAARIVEHRREHGPFDRIEDLLAVRGIGPKLLTKIRDRITIGAGGAETR